MIDVKIYEQIRYFYAVEKLSQRAIARKLGVSRNTVRRYCKGENVPWESKPRKYSDPVTGPIEQIVKEWLEADRTAPHKQRHTAECMHISVASGHPFR